MSKLIGKIGLPRIYRELHRDHATGELAARTVLPERNAIMDRIQRIRNEGVVRSNLSFGLWALSIPKGADIRAVHAMYPDTQSMDSEIRTRAWRKFMDSPMSKPYRVQEKI